MAITLNKYAALCVEIALANGNIGKDSSARQFLYDISRNWRVSLDATAFKSLELPEWNEKEIAACEIAISALSYLQRIGCRDIEQLLKDVIAHKARMNGL